MFLRYLGLSIMAVGVSFVGTQAFCAAVVDLPEIRRENKEAEIEEPIHKSIVKAAKRRVKKIIDNPKDQIIEPLTYSLTVAFGCCLGHSTGIRQGIEQGVENGLRKFEKIITEHVPEAYKPVVQGMLDKKIKRSNIYKNVRHGMFKDKVDVIDYNWEKAYEDFYGTPEDKELEVSLG